MKIRSLLPRWWIQVGRKQYAANQSRYNPVRDVGLYVISDDDMLMENVNSVLKRKGIIGVTDAAGSIRYFVDGRRDAELTASQLENCVTGFDQDGSIKEREQLYDVIAHRVFIDMGFDMSHIGSNILMSIVTYMVRNELHHVVNLKEICAMYEDEFRLSYHQMVRNIRYAVSATRIGNMRSKDIIYYLTNEIRKVMMIKTSK